MSLSTLVFFYRRRLRARRVQELFALVGIAVGVALLYAVQVSSTSLSASVRELTEGLFGRAQVQLVARDPHGLDQRIATALADSQHVRAAVPVLELPASIDGSGTARSVTLIGVDARVGELGQGRLPAGYGAVVASLRALAVPKSLAREVGARFGGQVTLNVGGRAVPIRVGLVLDRDEFGILADTPIVIVPLAYAQELAGLEGRVSRVYVAARPGREAAVSRLLAAVAGGRMDVRPVAHDAQVFEQASLPNDQSTGLFAAISAFVGFLFAFNALLLVAGQRRELIAALRLWGFHTGSIVRVLLFDALVLGIVASAVGLALGELLSRTVFPPSPGYLALAFPVGEGREVAWWTIALALGAGVLAALLATLVPLLAEVTGGDRQGDEQTGRLTRLVRSGWTLAGSLLLLTGTTIIIVVAPEAAFAGIVALVGSMLLLLPRVLSAALTIGEIAQHRVRRSAVLLAVGELRVSGVRSVAIAGIAGIALVGSVAIEGSHRDLQRGLDQDVHELSSVTDVWVSAAGASNALATIPFDAGVAGRVQAAAGVAGVEVQRGGFLDVGDRRVWVMAPPASASVPVPASQVLDGDPAVTAQRLRGRGWVAISQALADEHGLGVGEAFTLRSPVPRRMRVAAIISNLGWTPGTIVLNAGDYRRGWGSTDASALRVTLDEGVDPGEGRTIVEAALGPASGLTVETAAEREHRQQQTARQGLARLTQIAALVLGAAAFAMAAAMGAMVWQRRQRIAAVKLLGIRSRRVWHALLLESAILLGVGCTLGAIYGIYGAQLLNRTLTTVTGFPVQSTLALPVAAGAYAILALTAFTIAATTSYLAAQTPTHTALQE